ncbi:Protein WWC2 [Halotydeus destructor]|nr:Protein WWC2 [Halotydeus destructor]
MAQPKQQSTDSKLTKANRVSRGGQSVPLPTGWEAAQDEMGKVFYVDHNTKKTQWFDPRDRLTKPLTIADCNETELPYGWEQAYDTQCGVFFVDHLRKKHQFEDPRVEWRNLQINMLNSYMQQASEAGEIRNSMASIFSGSQKELSHPSISNNFANSRPSLTPLPSSNNPILPLVFNKAILEQSLTDAKLRVAQLKRELDANYNLLTIIDKYYKKGDADSAAIEV